MRDGHVIANVRTVLGGDQVILIAEDGSRSSIPLRFVQRIQRGTSAIQDENKALEAPVENVALLPQDTEVSKTPDVEVEEPARPAGSYFYLGLLPGYSDAYRSDSLAVKGGAVLWNLLELRLLSLCVLFAHRQSFSNSTKGRLRLGFNELAVSQLGVGVAGLFYLQKQEQDTLLDPRNPTKSLQVSEFRKLRTAYSIGLVSALVADATLSFYLPKIEASISASYARNDESLKLAFVFNY